MPTDSGVSNPAFQTDDEPDLSTSAPADTEIHLTPPPPARHAFNIEEKSHAPDPPPPKEEHGCRLLGVLPIPGTTNPAHLRENWAALDAWARGSER